MKYFDNNKKQLFPEIKDFKNNMSEFRYETNINKLTYKQWFWFHPSAYKLLSYGMFVIGALIFGIASFFMIKYNIFLSIALFILSICNILLILQKIKNEHKYKNFYDVYLREF